MSCSRALALLLCFYTFLLIGSPAHAAAYAMADIPLPGSKSMQKHLILYRQTTADDWQYSALNISGETKTYRISWLNPKIKYEYSVVSYPKKGDVKISNAKLMKTFTAEQRRQQLIGKKFKAVGANQARVNWNFKAGTTSYTIYYRELGQENWTHSVPGLSNTTNRYTIRSLNPRESYEYLIMAKDKKGKESKVAQKVLQIS